MRLLLAASLLLSFLGCEKEKGPVAVPVGFLLEATITPNARTMRRGDTLWLNVNCSDSLLDKNSGRRYRVRPQDLALNTGVLYKQLLGVGREPAGIARSFRLVERVGRATINGSTTGGVTLVHDGARYRARIGLIPSQAGVTSIALLVFPNGPAREAIGRPLPFIVLPPDVQGRKQYPLLDESLYVINDGKANNFDLFAQHTRASALEPGTTENQIIYEQKSTFTVEVQ